MTETDSKDRPEPCQEVILQPRTEPPTASQRQAWNVFWQLVLGRIGEKAKLEKDTD